ncbi:hypothetical protein [Agrobacterium tumefaciens]|uniref:hypothetical protein n=1 Tax=Agrobacterium tumefaciens TaxID=358 RepID=UPI0021CFE24E|nr:hypothetical protein [Agrobacterium tumefaciens]UXT99928.1 hypothetical protein FY129_20985 [Agrobacterium tumefaciens]
MQKFAQFNDDGFPAAFFSREIHGEGIPSDAVEITESDWQELIANTGRRRWVNGAVAVYSPPIVPEPEAVITVFAIDFWTRLDGGEDGNGGEVARVLSALNEQPVRIRKIFESATSYRSDHELWPLLQQIATTLFGEERATQILAPSQD